MSNRNDMVVIELFDEHYTVTINKSMPGEKPVDRGEYSKDSVVPLLEAILEIKNKYSPEDYSILYPIRIDLVSDPNKLEDEYKSDLAMFETIFDRYQPFAYSDSQYAFSIVRKETRVSRLK